LRIEQKLLAVVAALMLAALPTQAAPVAAVTQDGITVTLYDEPCALEAVANLCYRATWHDPKRGHFEGCYTVQHHTIVVLYFDDRTVVVLPLQIFQPPSPRPSGMRL
jgi:hypothetical protein